MCQNKHLGRNRNESTNMIPHAEGLDLAGSIDVRSGFGIVRSHRHICWRTDTLKKPKKSWKPTRFLDIRLTCRDASAVKVLEQQDRLFADVMSYSTSYLHYICNLYMFSLTSQTSRSSAVCQQVLEPQALFCYRHYSHHL